MTSRDRLVALEAFGVKLGLDNIVTLLDALGHPERAYPSVHVAGTNGKGSVCAMVERALAAAGRRTGLYTSPHLDRIEERLTIAGRAIAPADFDRTADTVLDVVDRLRGDGRLAVMPTFFEVTTAMAFEAFCRAGVDAAVVEVGLGGRFDATNAITPLCGAITSIAFDHERHLGTTLAAIAGEKAGIAKPGVPLVVGSVSADAYEAIERAARAAGAPLAGPAAVVDSRFDRGVATAVFATDRRRYGPVPLGLAGRHQLANAAVAVRLLELAAEGGLAIEAADIETGLREARWPGRLEWLGTAHGELLIDAAHNPAGAAALASFLIDAGVAPIPVAMAAMRDKDLAGMVAALAPLVSVFVATEAAHARSRRSDELAASIRALAPGVPVVSEADPMAAARVALEHGGRAAAAGSIFFVGPLRARLIAGGARTI